MMKQNFAVLGAGNGGQVIAAYLKLKGKQVTLYDRFSQVLEPIRRRGGIQLEGVSDTGFAKLDLVTEDVPQAVQGAEVIFVVLPAFAHAYVAQQLAGCLTDGQTVVVCPGATGGALEFRAVWDRAGCTAKVRLCETNSLFYAARASDGVATISGVKDELSLAALPAADTQGIIDDLADVYPQLIPAANVLETSLNNMNTVVHPLPVLLNAGRIESGERYRHYMDGITPAIGDLIEQMDQERLAVGRAYGLDILSLRDAYVHYYHVQAEKMSDLCHLSTAHAGIMAPTKLDSRLIVEDVPMGLVPISALGKAAGVPTPIIDSVITLAGALVKQDFWQTGRTLKSLNIAGLTREELLARL